MKHDTVAWSLLAGDQRYIYVIHGRHVAMKSEANWVVGLYSSEGNAHDFAVKATAGHGSRGKIMEGPVSFTMHPEYAKDLREAGAIPSDAEAFIDTMLAAGGTT